MRILFYTHAFSGGGAEIVFGRLAGALADEGANVIFAADHGQPPADRPGLRHLALGPSHVQSTLKLVALLRRETPDASFSALGAQNLKHLAAATLAGRRTRCVLGYHGFAEAEPKPLARSSYRLAPLLTRAAARSICVSDSLLDDMVQRWGGHRGRMVRIYNPVAEPATAGEGTRDHRLILALGRLARVKRFGDLVEAFSSEALGDARLALLGEGPDVSALREQIRRLRLEDRVELVGHVDDPSVWYGRAACVAIASASESFGLTAAEALAHGVPVVTTACGGPPEVIGPDPRCGRVVPVGDVAALAAALAATLADFGDPAPRRARAAAFALATARDAYAALARSLG